MPLLILGLILFIGAHCVRILVPQWRLAVIDAKGEGLWKGGYSLVSLAGLALLIWGYALAKDGAEFVYTPVEWGRPLSFFIVPLALWLVLASNFPAGFLKRFTQHPMLWGTLIWATSHVLNNGDLPSVVLFGSFLVWSIIALVSSYRRPNGPAQRAHWWPDVVSLIIALGLTVAFVAFLHEWLFGVAIA